MFDSIPNQIRSSGKKISRKKKLSSLHFVNKRLFEYVDLPTLSTKQPIVKQVNFLFFFKNAKLKIFPTLAIFKALPHSRGKWSHNEGLLSFFQSISNQLVVQIKMGPIHQESLIDITSHFACVTNKALTPPPRKQTKKKRIIRGSCCGQQLPLPWPLPGIDP